MKIKYFLTIVILLFCMHIISTTGFADDDHYLISIVEKDAIISRITQHPRSDIVYFNISITLKNSGTIVSDNITVEIEDDEGIIVKRNGTIPPGETKTYLFTEHPLAGMHQHTINISYYPTLDTIKRTTNNQGIDTYILLPSTEKPSTPGFEFCFFISALTVLFLFVKYVKKTRKR